MPCDSDGWWYSPACKTDPDMCIPALLGGIDWLGLETCRVIKYNDLPLAVSFLAWPDERIKNHSVTALFFWWRPDWSYKSVGAVRRILFPKHNRREWHEGVYRTDFPDIHLKKYMWKGVGRMSRAAAHFFTRFEMTLSDMEQIMEDMNTHSGSGDPDLKATIACKWVHTNERIWRSWIPSPTDCTAGTGLVNQNNEFVFNVKEARTCQPCPPGTKSFKPNRSEQYACQECEVGKFSGAYYSEACTACPPGSYAGSGGVLSCTPCPPGKFSNAEGMTTCQWCEPGFYAAQAGTSACVETVREVWLAAIQPFTGGVWDAGVSMRIGAEIMLEEINKHPMLLKGFELKVIWQDGQCSKNIGAKLFMENLYHDRYTVFAPGMAVGDLDSNHDGTITTSDTAPFNETWGPTDVFPGVVGLLGSGCSPGAMAIAPTAYQAYYPMVSNSATRPSLSDRKLYPNFFRTILPDTFFCAAWLALAKMLGQASVAVIIGDTATWSSMGLEMVRAAKVVGVSLLGDGISVDITGFAGAQVSSDSQGSAREAARALLRLKPRVVPLLMFERRSSLVICEAHRAGFLNAVFMSFGWFAFGWWSRSGTDCTSAELTAMATGLIQANMKFWRVDGDTSLSCSEAMTAEEFKVEWFQRQGKAVEDLSKSEDGYPLAKEASTTADAVCMYAMMLQEVLVVERIPLGVLAQRTGSAYDAVQEAFAATNFEGVQGTVSYAPNSADPDGTVLLQQLQAGDKIVDIAEYKQGSFYFLGKGNLVFQFSGETFTAGPPVATSISGALLFFQICAGGQSLNMASNMCEDCSTDEIFLDALGGCACKAGTYKDANGKCPPCAAGSFASLPGPGKYAPARRFLTSCLACGVGSYANSPGHGECAPCPGNGRFPELWTTLELIEKSGTKQWILAQGAVNISFCGCDVGTRQVGPMECVACEEGLSCLGMNEVFVKEGYASEATVSVYSCLGDIGRCVGGPPGITCALGFVGPACAKCAAGRRQSGAECELCDDSAMIVTFAATWIVIVIVCVMMYNGNTRKAVADSSSPSSPVVYAFASSISYAQVVAVACSFSITFPSSQKNTFKHLDVFTLELAQLHLDTGCVSGNTFRARFSLRLLWPLLFLLGFFFLFCLTRLVKCIVEFWVGRAVISPLELIPRHYTRLSHSISVLDKKCTIIPLEVQVAWWWPAKLLHIKSAIISCHMLVFIALTKCAVSVFTFQKHPNGKSTITLYPDVTAYSSEWWAILPLALVGILCYTVGFFAFVAYIVIVAPERFGASDNFRFMYGPLWKAYDADTWWFCLAQIVYGLVINFIPVVIDNGQWQLAICELLVIAYIKILSEERPWRSHLNHSCDLATKLGTCVFVILTLKGDSPGMLLLVVLILPLVYVAGKIVLYIWSHTAVVVKTTRERVEFAQRLDDITRIVGNMELMKLREYTLSLLDNDVFVLDQALNILQYTVLGLQHKSRWLWRCDNIPHQVAVDGRLEGEVEARDVRKPSDHRPLVRTLLAVLWLRLDGSSGPQGAMSLKKSNFILWGIQRSLRPEVQRFISWLDEAEGVRTPSKDDTARILTKDKFVSSVLKYLQENPPMLTAVDASTECLTEEELAAVFDYVDLDMSGRVSWQELAVQLTALPEPTWDHDSLLCQGSSSENMEDAASPGAVGQIDSTFTVLHGNCEENTNIQNTNIFTEMENEVTSQKRSTEDGKALSDDSVDGLPPIMAGVWKVCHR